MVKNIRMKGHRRLLWEEAGEGYSPSRAESASTELTVGAQTLRGDTPREGWRAGHAVRAALAGGIGTVHSERLWSPPVPTPQPLPGHPEPTPPRGQDTASPPRSLLTPHHTRLLRDLCFSLFPSPSALQSHRPFPRHCGFTSLGRATTGAPVCCGICTPVHSQSPGAVPSPGSTHIPGGAAGGGRWR